MTKNLETIKKTLKQRHRKELLFKYYGMFGIALAVLFLFIILSTIVIQGKKAFFSTYIKLEVFFDPEIIDPKNSQSDEDIRFANFKKIIDRSLKKYFPTVTEKKDLRKLSKFISNSEEENLLKIVLNEKNLIGQKKKYGF